MRRTRAFATSSFRLAGLYTLLFAGSVAVLGAVVFFSAHAAMQDQLRDRVTTETASLLSSYESEGLGAVADLVRERSRSPAALDYRIEDRNGRVLAGDLPRPRVRSGWSVLTEPEDKEEDHGEESVLAWTAALDGEGLLVVGEDLARVQEADEAILRAFGSAFALVLVLGVAGGWVLSRGFLNRVDAITLTAQAIIDGDLSRRIPLEARSNDELEQLGAARTPPGFTLAGLALRAVAVAAGVVLPVVVAAALARQLLATQCGCAAGNKPPPRLGLRRGQGMVVQIRRAKLTQHIGQGDHGVGLPLQR